MMRTPLAAVIILGLSIVWSLFEGVQLLSYEHWHLADKDPLGTDKIMLHSSGADMLSYTYSMDPAAASYIHYAYQNQLSYSEGPPKKARCRRWIEKLGGDGPTVACYVRVSSARQANEGFSVEAQIEKLRKMIEKYSPSQVYWFIDPGMTGTRFDNRAVVDIMQLRKQIRITELWVCDIDRIGRDAPKLIMFFFDFCENGGKIKTPETVYDNSRELGTFILLAVKAFAAQDANQSRSKACIAGKGESFRQGHWNKIVPLGYKKIAEWIKKLPCWEDPIKELFALFLTIKNEAKVAEEINKKYGAVLNMELERHHIVSIISDPAYIGRPQHLGVVVEDPSLAFVDEETFRNCQEIITSKERERKPAKRDALQEMLAIEHVWALRFIEKKIVFRHRGCGGTVDKNGAFRYNGIRQQLFLCRKCKAQWRVPAMSQLDEQKLTLLDDSHDLMIPSSKKKTKPQIRKERSLADFFGWDEPIKNPDNGMLFEWLFR